MTNQFQLKELNPPYFFHCALSKVKLIDVGSKRLSRSEFIKAHLYSIENNFGQENLIFPSFNFDFKKTGEFRPKSDDTYVGALSNHLIRKERFYRSHTPFFSCISPNYEFIKDYVNRSYYAPFSENSIFGDLYKSDGSIILYGTNVSAVTFIHFIEHFAGPPIYRYDKFFHGQVITESNSKDVEVKFHVRPWGMDLDYDWPKIEKILRKNGALLEIAPNIHAVKARAYSSSLGNLLNQEDFPLLEELTRKKVVAKYKQLGRRFEYIDFEDSSLS